MQKKYSVNIQDDELVSIEIDGKVYYSLDDIPDEDDRDHVEHLIEDAKDTDFDKERERFMGEIKPSKMPLMLFVLFLSIAVLMLIISAISAVSAINGMAKEKSLPGRVVSMVERRSSDGNVYYYPEVEVRFPDETSKKLQLTTGSWPPAYEVGQKVTVLYNAENPRDASIQSSEGSLMRFLVTLITGVLGLAFIGASLLVRWITKQEPQEEQSKKAFQNAVIKEL